jgi:hypothetical protein
MLFQSLQQLSGLFQPALPDPQVGQPDDRRSAPLWHAPVKVAGGVDELHLRLLPAPGCGKDAATMRAAECGDRISVRHHIHPAVLWGVLTCVREDLDRPGQPSVLHSQSPSTFPVITPRCVLPSPRRRLVDAS